MKSVACFFSSWTSSVPGPSSDRAQARPVRPGPFVLTLARVSERAGYSRGIVTHYFGSKQELIDGYLGALAHSSTAGHAFLLL